jgi:hypothetical protein
MIDNYIKVSWREEHRRNLDVGAPKAHSKEFPFDSMDDASRESAQADAREAVKKLKDAGFYPQLAVYRNTRGLSMRVVGVAA